MKLKKTKAGIVLATVLLSTIGMGVGQAAAAEPSDSPNQTEQSCYIGKYVKKPKSALGVTVATMVMENKWCVKDGEVIESRLTHHRAETSTPFNRVVHLPEFTGGSSIVDNTAVAWKQFTIMFEIQTGFISLTKPSDLCLRLFGSANGTIEGDRTCGAY